MMAACVIPLMLTTTASLILVNTCMFRCNPKKVDDVTEGENKVTDKPHEDS